MSTRPLLLGAALVASFAACVGDDPLAASPVEPDAGNDAAVHADATDEGPSRVTLTVDSAELTRGAGGALIVHASARSGPPVTLTLQVQGGPAGIDAPGTALLAPDQNDVRIAISASEAAPYGEAALQVVATGAGSPLVVPAHVFVRGQSGRLDTTFGVGGRAIAPPAGSTLRDARYAVDGSLVVVGEAPAVAVRYGADGQIGPGGVVPLPLQAGAASWQEVGLLDEGAVGVPGFVYRGGSSFYSEARFAADGGLPALDPPTLPPGARTRYGLEAFAILQQAGRFYDVTQSFGPTENQWVPVTIRQYDDHTALVKTWAASGALSLEEPDGHYAVQQIVAAGGRVYVAGRSKDTTNANDTKDAYDVRIVDLAAATVQRAALATRRPAEYEITQPYGLLEPAPDGTLVAVLSGAERPCLTRIHLDGSLDDTLRCPAAFTTDRRPSGGAALADGRLAVIALGPASTLWVTDSNGLVSAGTALEGLQQANVGALRVLGTTHDRIVVAYRGGAGSGWHVERYWL